MTDNGDLYDIEASQALGIPVPDKVIPIVDNDHFIPNKPPEVQTTNRYMGGGTDYINPERVPATDIQKARPVKGYEPLDESTEDEDR